MAYLILADFRAGTLKEYTNGLALGTDEAAGGIADANLTALIATCSALFDRYTGDHFEPEAALTLKVSGEGSSRLWMPKRIRAVTSVTTTYPGGTTVTVPSSSYAFEIFDGDFSLLDHESEIAYAWPGYWPGGDDNITVVGDFSWPTTPGEIKRAVALMCWERVRAVGDYLRFADTFTQDGGTVVIGAGPISRIPEAQQIADFFRRKGRA